MHGTTMMFLFAVPVMLGMGVYLVPLMVGTRNIAFPRMIAYATGCTCSAARCSTPRSC
jgi:cytochrome c oxidase subunit 1